MRVTGRNQYNNRFNFKSLYNNMRSDKLQHNLSTNSDNVQKSYHSDFDVFPDTEEIDPLYEHCDLEKEFFKEELELNTRNNIELMKKLAKRYSPLSHL